MIWDLDWVMRQIEFYNFNSVKALRKNNIYTLLPDKHKHKKSRKLNVVYFRKLYK
jgi:hypothetical protein